MAVFAVGVVGDVVDEEHQHDGVVVLRGELAFEEEVFLRRAEPDHTAIVNPHRRGESRLHPIREHLALADAPAPREGIT